MAAALVLMIGLVLDGGGNVASGSRLKQWNYDGSTNLHWQLVALGSGWYRLVNRTNGLVADSGGNTAVIENNRIGTNAAGTAALANPGGGIDSGQDADNPTIVNNVISGGGGISFLNIDGAVIQGNFIGTNADGSAAIGNPGDGISLDASPDAQILNNVISGNSSTGITLGPGAGDAVECPVGEDAKGGDAPTPGLPEAPLLERLHQLPGRVVLHQGGLFCRARLPRPRPPAGALPSFSRWRLRRLGDADLLRRVGAGAPPPGRELRPLKTDHPPVLLERVLEHLDQPGAGQPAQHLLEVPPVEAHHAAVGAALEELAGGEAVPFLEGSQHPVGGGLLLQGRRSEASAEHLVGSADVTAATGATGVLPVAEVVDQRQHPATMTAGEAGDALQLLHLVVPLGAVGGPPALPAPAPQPGAAFLGYLRAVVDPELLQRPGDHLLVEGGAGPDRVQGRRLLGQGSEESLHQVRLRIALAVEILVGAAVGPGPQQHGAGGLAAATGPADLLVIALHASG